MDKVLTDETRGKRKFSYALFVSLVALTIGGFWHEGAWEMAKFYSPFIFPLMGGLWLGDAYFANQRVLVSSGGSSNYRSASSYGTGERSGSVPQLASGEREYLDNDARGRESNDGYRPRPDHQWA